MHSSKQESERPEDGGSRPSIQGEACDCSLTASLGSMRLLGERDPSTFRTPEIGIRITDDGFEMVRGTRLLDSESLRRREEKYLKGNSSFDSFEAYAQSYRAGRLVTSLGLSTALQLKIGETDYLVGTVTSDRNPPSFSLISATLDVGSVDPAFSGSLATLCCNQLLSGLNNVLLPHKDGEIIRKKLGFNPESFMGDLPKTPMNRAGNKPVPLFDPFFDSLRFAEGLRAICSPSSLPECLYAVDRGRPIVMTDSVINGNSIRGYVHTDTNSFQLVAGMRLVLRSAGVSLGCSEEKLDVSSGMLETAFNPVGAVLLSLDMAGELTGHAYRLEQGRLKPLATAEELLLPHAFAPQLCVTGRETGLVAGGGIKLMDCVPNR